MANRNLPIPWLVRKWLCWSEQFLRSSRYRQHDRRLKVQSSYPFSLESGRDKVVNASLNRFIALERCRGFLQCGFVLTKIDSARVVLLMSVFLYSTFSVFRYVWLLLLQTHLSSSRIFRDDPISGLPLLFGRCFRHGKQKINTPFMTLSMLLFKDWFTSMSVKAKRMPNERSVQRVPQFPATKGSVPLLLRGSILRHDGPTEEHERRFPYSATVSR